MSHPLIDLAYGCANTSHSAHLAHFNVVGPNFAGLHKLYQDVYEYLDGWYDTFGERVRALNVAFEARSVSPRESFGSEGEHAATLLQELDALCDQSYLVYEGYDEAEEADNEDSEDPVSANLVLEFQTGLDKLRWMLRATLGKG